MSTSTEICLADVRQAGGTIMRAQQVAPDSPTGRRLQYIADKIQELVRVLESQILTERENHQ